MFKIYNLTPVIYPDIKDTKYREIDDFESYEYNNCIAYEFAIRNSEILSELERFERKFIKLEKDYPYYSKDELIRYINYYDFYILYNAGFDIGSMIYWLFMKRAKRLSFFSNLNNDELCKYFMKIDAKGESHAYYKHIQPLKRLFNPVYISGSIAEGLSSSYIKIKNRNIHEITTNKKGRVMYLDVIDPNWNPTGWSDEIKIQDTQGYLLPSIIMTHKRPIIRVIDRHEHFSIPINMGMTKTDLKTYISLLKDEYDKRANIDTESYRRFINSRSKYLNKPKKSISEEMISLMTFKGIDNLYQSKNRVFTVSDLFGDNFYRNTKPKSTGKLTAEKVKKLLCLYDSITYAEEFNEKLKIAKDHDLKKATTIEQKNDIEIYYENEVINISKLQDELYREWEKRVKKVPKNHKISQYYTLSKKLIANKAYKFLI